MTYKNIVWLASYPKSGNTWTRVVLANYLLGQGKPFPINDLHKFGMGDSVVKRYQQVQPGPFDRTNDLDVMKRRGLVLGRLAANGADMNFSKTHNQNDIVFGVPLIPVNLTRAAIYIVRDPRDVALSYAKHFALDLDASVSQIADQNSSSGGGPESPTVRQFFGGWSAHFQSWTRQRDFPMHVMRYEDMLEKPEHTFGQMLEALGVPVDQGRLEQAIAFSDFQSLQSQEDKAGFKETAPDADRFFVSGKAGRWRDDLPETLAQRIVQDHGPVMRKLGYLST